MESFPASLANPVLSSLWDDLSPHLIASFYPVERVGQTRNWQRVQGMPVVRAPLTECTLDISLGWQSPFEDAGTNVMPTFKAMLQSGALQPFVDSSGAMGQTLSKFEGRTGITKLNSTQVFNGMPPLKFQVSALFRAWRDPASEVEAPFNELMKWALPVELANDGPIMALLESIKKTTQGKPLDEAVAHSLMPSLAPTKIAMQYKGRVFSPLVIESIGMPMNSPVDARGKYVELVVPMTICSLTAIDAKDWVKITTSSTGFTA